MANRSAKRGKPTRGEVYAQLATGLGATAGAVEKSAKGYMEAELRKVHRMLWIILAVALFGVHYWLGLAYCLLWAVREATAHLRRRRGRPDPASQDRGPAPPSP